MSGAPRRPMPWCCSAPPAICVTARSFRRCITSCGAGGSTSRSSAWRAPGWNTRAARRARARQHRARRAAARCEACSRSSARSLRYVDGDYSQDATFAALRKALGDAASVRCTTWRFRRACFRSWSRNLGKSGCARDARVVVEKPFGRDLASARELNRVLHARAAGELDLPHRSFPRQGAGAEHPLFPLRQLLSRAGVEPQFRRERADHHGGEASASRGAGASTKRRARSATSCRTTCSKSWRCSRWSRRSTAARRRCATRRSRCSRRRARCDPSIWCAASIAAIAASPASRPIRKWRPTRRCVSKSIHGAGAACRSTSAPASACR